MYKNISINVFVFLISIATWASDSQLPLGLQRRGLTHTVSAALLDRIAEMETPEEFKEIEHFDQYEAPTFESMQIVRPTNKKLSFYVNYRLIHPLGNRIPNHLVFLIPGFGSENQNGAIKYCIELLSQWGFSVAVFDSPASKRFIEKTSEFGIPGIQTLDAADLYEGIKLARAQLEKNISKNFKYTKISVLGLSLGGLNAQMIQLLSAADSSNSAIKFHRVISINPPIQNAYGLDHIDRMIINFKKRETANLLEGILSLAFEFPLRSFGFHQLGEMALDLQNSSLTSKNAEDLIAYGFANTVQKAIIGYQTRHPKDNRSFANIQTFHELFNKITMFHLLKNTILKKDIRLQSVYKTLQSNQTVGMDNALLAQDSIFNNSQILSEIESFRIITFDDDFLISDHDADWLRNNFKNHSVVFSNGGGHLGGFHRQDFQNTLRHELEAN